MKSILIVLTVLGATSSCAIMKNVTGPSREDYQNGFHTRLNSHIGQSPEDLITDLGMPMQVLNISEKSMIYTYGTGDRIHSNGGIWGNNSFSNSSYVKGCRVNYFFGEDKKVSKWTYTGDCF